MALTWQRSNSILDEGTRMSLLLFDKEPACGSVQLTLDDKDPITFFMYSNIKVQISLNIEDADTTKTMHNEDSNVGIDFQQPKNELDNTNQDFVHSASLETETLDTDNSSLYVQPKIELGLEVPKSDNYSDHVQENIMGPNLPKAQKAVKKSGAVKLKRGRPKKSANLEQGSNGRKRKHKALEVEVKEESEDCLKEDKLKKLPRIILKPVKVKKNGTLILKTSKKKTTLKDTQVIGAKKDSKLQASVVKKDSKSSKIAKLETVMKPEKKEKRPTSRFYRKQITCEYCEKKFATGFEFYDHKKIPNLPSFFCVLCNKDFPFKAFLEIHEKFECQHTNDSESRPSRDEMLVCQQCGYKARDVYLLKRHTMQHTGEFQYKCCMCEKLFVEAGTLSNHLRSHVSGGMMNCKCCNQKFATRSALAKHKVATMEIKCHLCGQNFQNRTTRTEHYKLCHQDDILRCPQCDRMFSSQKEFDYHQEKHKVYKKKPCPICGKYFTSVKKHIPTHGQISESDMFVCDKCPMKFAHLSSFLRHQASHSTELYYQCPHCPRKFADCSILRRHLSSHSTAMPYQCDICGKKCKEAGNLRKHMRIHSKTRPFSCTKCPLTFNHKGSMVSHIQSVHPDDKEEVQTSATVAVASDAQPALETTADSAVNEPKTPAKDLRAENTDKITSTSTDTRKSECDANTSSSTENSRSTFIQDAKTAYYESLQQNAAMNLSFAYTSQHRSMHFPMLAPHLHQLPLPPPQSHSAADFTGLPLHGDERWMQQF